jgi:16S rRNA (guanine966-N2)-methyltransferase
MIHAMRIVGGIYGGRVLRAPAGSGTRPTSEKVREAMFAILNHVRGPMAGARVLDLFAGSGALGIEALSRGASHATFVDASKLALAAIRANISELEGLTTDQTTVVAASALAFLTRPCAAPWDVVLIDPPYATDLAQRAAAALTSEHLAANAAVAIEHDRRHVPPDELGSLLRTDQRRYGDTLVSFYVRGSK